MICVAANLETFKKGQDKQLGFLPWSLGLGRQPTIHFLLGSSIITHPFGVVPPSYGKHQLIQLPESFVSHCNILEPTSPTISVETT